jgi:hypothetical protein
MSRLWKFLGVQDVPEALREQVRIEMSSNPDGEWQAERNEGIASFLPKGQAGNWSRLFTEKDRSVFKEIAGDMLIHWRYEQDSAW